MQFPHCDQRILHEPNSCAVCDLHPEWQELRIAWGIAFTGNEPVRKFNQPRNFQLPCPADFNRENNHQAWGGNRPVPPESERSEQLSDWIQKLRERATEFGHSRDQKAQAIEDARSDFWRRFWGPLGG